MASCFDDERYAFFSTQGKFCSEAKHIMAKEKVDDGLITAVYKVNLHCPQCATDIRKPLMKTQGVLDVVPDFGSHQIKVKGRIDPKKTQERIEKLIKRKVELVSPQVKVKTTTVAAEKIVKETKEAPIQKTVLKAHLHCETCELDVKNKLLKHKGIFDVKTDMKAQTVTVEGIIESEKLVTYMRKKLHKHAEIIPPKPAKIEEVKKETVETKTTVSTTSFKIEEFKEEKKVEVKDKDGTVPYFIHYVYAPQYFSEENPNACCVM